MSYHKSVPHPFFTLFLFFVSAPCTQHQKLLLQNSLVPFFDMAGQWVIEEYYNLRINHSQQRM